MNVDDGCWRNSVGTRPKYSREFEKEEILWHPIKRSTEGIKPVYRRKYLI